MTASLWTNPTGRELDASLQLSDARARPERLVACLNVWNDVDALKRTVPTWISQVDHVIAVDGSYDTLGASLSTDGTREYLRSFRHVQLVDAAGLSQCAKRSSYFDLARAGDYLFVIDADEMVQNAQALRTVPVCDVGWVMIVSPAYARPYNQPRIIRWQPELRYRGRHHWMYQGERLLSTHQYGGPGYAHRTTTLALSNQPSLGRSAERRTAKTTHRAEQGAAEHPLVSMPSAKASDASLQAREALQIVHLAYRNDGVAPSRLHTAINRTTPHWSLFFKTRPDPFGVPTQYGTREHASTLAAALGSADIVHIHGVMSAARPLPPSTATVFHHHGTLFRRNAREYMRDATQRNALVLLSNLELFSWTDGAPAHFLPNAMPVTNYRAIRERSSFDSRGVFRIGHSPTHPERKGTDVFLTACAHLRATGLPIEPVMMHGLPHRDVLRIKATCDAFFDSFWLGMQCSGLEAAAMGMPVLAGDPTVAERYRERFGAVPYTFAENGEQLEHEMRRLVDDAEHRAAEANRAHAYVVQHHDESAVALRYLDLLDAHFHWRSVPLHKQRKPATRSSSSVAEARSMVR